MAIILQILVVVKVNQIIVSIVIDDEYSDDNDDNENNEDNEENYTSKTHRC